jgi:hypothetical protein
MLLVVLAGPSGAQTPRWDFPVTDGEVYAVALSGNTLYLGGGFTRVGPATGCGVPLGTSTGTPVSGFPVVGGPVYAAVPDGSGGWFVGGDFSAVGDSARSNLAHIRSDNSIATWSAGTDGPVRALALSGSTLYVGGEFYNIGPEWIPYLAAVNVTSGTVASWNPNCGGSVYALALNGTTLTWAEISTASVRRAGASSARWTPGPAWSPPGIRAPRAAA